MSGTTETGRVIRRNRRGAVEPVELNQLLEITGLARSSAPRVDDARQWGAMKELAGAIGVDIRTVQRWVKRDEPAIEIMRVGKFVLVRLADDAVTCGGRVVRRDVVNCRDTPSRPEPVSEAE